MVRPRGRTPATAQTHLPPLPSTSLPSPSPSLPCYPRIRTDAKKKFKKLFYFIFIFLINFLVVVAGLEREKKYFNFQFSVSNPQNPRAPRAPRASRAKPREEEGIFGLVPLVTHPSSIPLLGGLTPKFLSLSLHSL
jgi:hypothetical protein